MKWLYSFSRHVCHDRSGQLFGVVVFFFAPTHTHRERESRNIPKFSMSELCVCGKATEMSGIFTLEEVTKKTGVHGTSQWANSRVEQPNWPRASATSLQTTKKENKKRKSRYFFTFHLKKELNLFEENCSNNKLKNKNFAVRYYFLNAWENRSCFRMCDVSRCLFQTKTSPLIGWTDR